MCLDREILRGQQRLCRLQLCRRLRLLPTSGSVSCGLVHRSWSDSNPNADVENTSSYEYPNLSNDPAADGNPGYPGADRGDEYAATHRDPPADDTDTKCFGLGGKRQRWRARDRGAECIKPSAC